MEVFLCCPSGSIEYVLEKQKIMHDQQIEALFKIHESLPRKGPGSDKLARSIIQRLVPKIPENPQIADLGCGNGHTSFLLAEILSGQVTAIDFGTIFIDELRQRLLGDPLAERITPVVGDMLLPDYSEASFHLIWSEGAAYAIGVENALKAWKPLLAPGGIVVFSECCWFTQTPNSEAASFWNKNYPGMLSVGQNITLAENLGYRFLASEVLPQEDWWTSYFDPLGKRLDQLQPNIEPASILAETIVDARFEADLFRRNGDQYGYAFFVLQVI
jgi:SAM-dependent methyltransferase